MRAYMELGLVGLLLSGDDRPTEEQNPQLFAVLRDMGFNAYWNESKEELVQHGLRLLDVIDTQFEYFDASELKVNRLTDNYLKELFDQLGNHYRENTRVISISVCALGNKADSEGCTDGVEQFLDRAKEIIEDLCEKFEEGTGFNGFRVVIDELMYIEKVLGIVDVFVTSHLGMLAGVEEFAPVDFNDVQPVQVVDWHAGLECNDTNECECGCQQPEEDETEILDHPIQLLQGLEDLLNGVETPAAKYAEGVFFANDMKLRALAGNEEGVLDSIKEAGIKAYEWCKDVLASFFDLFTSNTEKAKEVAETMADVAETNKKALQAMEKKGSAINDAAKKGILALAAKADPSGGMGRVVGGLNTSNDGSRVIDGLMALLKKAGTADTKVQEKLKKAQTALDELKTANNKASSTKGDNKEVNANVKANVNEKIKAAREAIKGIKAEAKGHGARMKAIEKAIRGITPAIFTKVTEGAATPKSEEKPAKAAKPAATPPAAPAKGKKK